MDRRATKMLRCGRISTVFLVVIVAAAGCAPTASPSTTPGPSARPASASPTRARATATAVLDRTSGVAADIAAILDARDRVHPDGWHGMKREDWIVAADAVQAKATELTDDQLLVELVRLAAMPSWNGRDGHSGIFPFIPGSGTHQYPVRWWRFSDGLVITAVGPGVDESLVGARVESIASRPIADVLALVEPLAPRDNPSNLLAYGPIFLRCSELLAGLGVIDRAGPTTFGIVDRDGRPRDVVIEPIAAEDDVSWNSGMPHRLPPRDILWLERQADPIWWTELEDSHTLYIQENSVQRGTGGIIDDIVARVQTGGIERVVLDIRHNGGGDNNTLGRLEELLQRPAIDRSGRLFVLIGRVTFSAAANLAADLERETSAIFVGEPMGGSPNLYGDAKPTDLPFGDQRLYTATRYWERSTPDDTRLTIDPDIPVAFSSDDYFEDRDPVLEAVLQRATGSG